MTPDQPPAAEEVPVSVGIDPIWDLLREKILEPPRRPGVAASLGRFDVLRSLGKGGMGIVLLARDATGTCAIKLLRPELIANDEAFHRFQVEAGHMRHLGHPNILRLLEVNLTRNRPYFVMPFIEGGSLARLIDHKPLAAELTLRIATQLAGALDYAHAHAITHRDIKPANVLIDNSGCTFLTDFGLGRTVYNDSIIDVRQPQTGGTPAYMAPELAAGKPGDTRCDTYSFGAVLYEMLTGQPPYTGDSPEQVLTNVRAGPPTPIREINPDAHPALAVVAECAMARELQDRYAEMSDALADLNSIAAGHQLVRGARRCRNLARMVSRRTVLLASTGAIAVAAATIPIWRARNSESRTNQPLSIRPPDPAPTIQLVREIRMPGVTTSFSTYVGGLNKQGAHDLYLLNGPELLVLSAHGKVLKRQNLAAPGRDRFRLDLVADVNRDGLDEPVVSWSEENRNGFTILNNDLKPVRNFYIKSHRQPLSRSSLQLWRVADLDDDDHREIYALLGNESGPRGLACFDLKHDGDGPSWIYTTAPSIECIEFSDLNDDGRQEILLGTYAPNNAVVIEDGTTDDQCYVYALSHDGKPAWKTPFRPGNSPRVFCGAYPLRRPRGIPDVYLWVTAGPDHRDNEVGKIYRLRSDGKQNGGPYDAGAQLMSCLITDPSADARLRLIATDRLGYVHILGDQLREIKREQILPSTRGKLDLLLRECADVNGDGLPELIFTASQIDYVSEKERHYYDNELIVTSLDLRVLCRFTIEKLWQNTPGLGLKVIDVDGDTKPEIIVFSDRVSVFRMQTSL